MLFKRCIFFLMLLISCMVICVCMLWFTENWLIYGDAGVCEVGVG